MRLSDLFRPSALTRKQEIEARLKEEKQNLDEATQRAARTFRGSILEGRVIRDYPIETAIAIMLGGYVFARLRQDRRSRVRRQKVS